MNRNISILFKGMIFSLFVILLASLISAASPVGASTTFIKSSGYSSSTSNGSVAGVAGNVTELNIFSQNSITNGWTGFYGNISGTMELADSNGNAFYNWSSTSPKGQVYVSKNSTIQWGNIQCFNFTAMGNYTSDIAKAGGTSLYGTNISQLESEFGITASDADSISKTFVLSGPSTHNSFVVGSLGFVEGQCMNTRILAQFGASEDNKFEEVLLYEPQSTSVVFTTILNDNVVGFDGGYHDFETMVPEDGHNGNTSPTMYYFFMELQ